MTEVNPEVKGVLGASKNPPAETKKNQKDTFTRGQSILLIVLTLLLSVGGWYTYGKMKIWVDIDMQRVNEQLAYYQQKVQSEPNNAQAHVDLGYTYFLKKQYSEAIKEFNQSVVIDPKFFNGYYNLGLVLIEEKRYNEALENLTKAIELSPRDYKGHLQMGIVYRNLDMFDESMKSLSRADELMPGNTDIIYEIGQVAEAQGDSESAIEIYKEALNYDPLYQPAVKALERLEKK